MKLNVPSPAVYTHEGARASRISPLAELERTVLACLLWEDNFYESGESVADRIVKLVPQCDEQAVSDLAVKARSEFHMRHAPLLLTAALAFNRSKLTAKTVEQVIQRADELGEFVTLYWQINGKKRPLSAQVKKGLAKAFRKFDAYQLGKYNRDAQVKLRDVMFLTHPKPKDENQAATWSKLAEGNLESPDTWEVALSGGADKGETFTRLLTEQKLGYMALLRNLRNMIDSGVDRNLIVRELLAGAGKSRALPFRFIAALRAAPSLAGPLDEAMQYAMKEMQPLQGHTAVCVDVSYSMEAALSGRSQMSRTEAAAGLAILIRGLCPDARLIGFGTGSVEIPAFQGLAIAEYLSGLGQKIGGGTYLGRATAMANKMGYDRVVVITDEQSHDGVSAPLAGTKAYMVNVAAYQHGVGYGQWTHISGFSDSIVKFIQASESNE